MTVTFIDTTSTIKDSTSSKRQWKRPSMPSNLRWHAKNKAHDINVAVSNWLYQHPRTAEILTIFFGALVYTMVFITVYAICILAIFAILGLVL